MTTTKMDMANYSSTHAGFRDLPNGEIDNRRPQLLRLVEERYKGHELYTVPCIVASFAVFDPLSNYSYEDLPIISILDSLEEGAQMWDSAFSIVGCSKKVAAQVWQQLEHEHPKAGRIWLTQNAEQAIQPIPNTQNVFSLTQYAQQRA